MRKVVLAAVLAAFLADGWAAVDQYLDVRYERLCIKHHADPFVQHGLRQLGH